MKLKKLTAIATITAASAIAQTILVAFLYGIDQEVESFFIAAAMLSTFVQFTLSGRIGELFIPVYHQLQHEKGLLAARRANTFLLLGTIMIGSIFVIGALALSSQLAALIGPGFASERQAHLAQMLRVLIPCLVLQLINANFATLAIAEKKFLFPEIGRLIGRLANIATIAICYPSMKEWALVAGYWISTLASICASGAACWAAGYRFEKPSLSERSFLSVVLNATPASIASIGAQQLYAISLNAALTYCPPGTVAIYNYCLRMITRLTGIIIRPAAIVFHSNFSRQLAGNSVSRKPLEAATEAVLTNTCVCVVAAWTSLPNSMYFLFGLEKLSRVDINYISILFATFLITYFLKGPSTIARKTAVSLGRGGTTYTVEAITNIACLGIACFLVFVFQRPGLIAAITLAALLRAATSYLPLRDRTDLVVIYRWHIFQQWMLSITASLSTAFLLRFFLADWKPSSRIDHLVKSAFVTLAALGVLLAVKKILANWNHYKMLTRRA